MKEASNNQHLKKAVGAAAADLVKADMVVGIGTGSTVAFFIKELGKRIQQGLKVQGVPTSYQSKLLCHQWGIPTLDPGMLEYLDLAVDGADEIDDDLNAIKGGGAAHTTEKIIASLAREFVLIADESKLVKNLGASFPIPVEVVPAALGLLNSRVRQLGGDPRLRMAVRKDGPVVTDYGHFVVDLYFSKAPDIHHVNEVLLHIPGVVETGLFIGIAKKALISAGDKIIFKTPITG